MIKQTSAVVFVVCFIVVVASNLGAIGHHTIKSYKANNQTQLNKVMADLYR